LDTKRGQKGGFVVFKTIVRDPTLTERTQEQLEQLIVDRRLRPGDRLPPQEELSKLLDVSRTVVREAVRHLIARGLLEGRRGSGVYVRAMSSDVLREPLDLLLRSQTITRHQIMEARELLEVKISGLAAERATVQDIEAMQAAIEKMAAGNLSPTEFAATDVAFHHLLARAADNPLFLAMANSINDVMIHLRLWSTKLYGLAEASKLAVQDHSQILERVKGRDVEGARRAMEEHLAQTRKVLDQVALSNPPEQPVSSRSLVETRAAN
jgi:GntR family transcriptional regulator, transcriptional repressor for pyruvate dehydrogenase complex